MFWILVSEIFVGGEGRGKFFSTRRGSFPRLGSAFRGGEGRGKVSGRRLKNFENLEIFEFLISINSGFWIVDIGFGF